MQDNKQTTKNKQNRQKTLLRPRARLRRASKRLQTLENRTAFINGTENERLNDQDKLVQASFGFVFWHFLEELRPPLRPQLVRRDGLKGGFRLMEIAAKQKVYKKVESRPECKSRTPVSRDHGKLEQSTSEQASSRLRGK